MQGHVVRTGSPPVRRAVGAASAALQQLATQSCGIVLWRQSEDRVRQGSVTLTGSPLVAHPAVSTRRGIDPQGLAIPPA